LRNRPKCKAIVGSTNKFSMVDPIKWLDEASKWEKLWKELFLPVR